MEQVMHGLVMDRSGEWWEQVMDPLGVRLAELVRRRAQTVRRVVKRSDCQT